MIRIKESSWSRIIQHLEGPKPFGVISAFQWQYNEKKNFQLHGELENDIRNMGYGFIEQKSGYSYTKANGEKGISYELSFFVPNITLEQVIKLGIKYGQESILYKDDKGFRSIYTTNNDGLHIGQIGMVYSKEEIVFDPELLKKAFSQLRRGTKNQINQKFSFLPECVSIEEGHPPTWVECMGSKVMLSIKWYQIA